MEDCSRGLKYPELVSFRAAEGTRAAIDEAAKRSQMDSSDWLRRVSVEAAEGRVGAEKLLWVLLAEVLAVRAILCSSAAANGLGKERIEEIISKADKGKFSAVERVILVALSA